MFTSENCNTSEPLNCSNGGYPDPRNCSICKWVPSTRHPPLPSLRCPSLFGGRYCTGRESSTLSSCGGVLSASFLLRRLSIQLNATQGEKETCSFMIRVADHLGVRVSLFSLFIHSISEWIPYFDGSWKCIGDMCSRMSFGWIRDETSWWSETCRISVCTPPFQPYRPYRLRYCCNISDDLILSHSDQVPLLFSVMGGNSTVISFLFKAGESSMINSYWSHRLVPSNITLNGTEPLIGQNIPHAAVVIPQKGQKRKKRKYNSSWRCWIRRQSVQKCRSTRNINKRHRYQTNSRKEFM